MSALLGFTLCVSTSTGEIERSKGIGACYKLLAGPSMRCLDAKLPWSNIFTYPTCSPNPKKQCYMQVAEDASLSVSGAGQRAEALRESLAGELEQAQAIAQAAQAARQKADEDIIRAQSQLKELKEQEEAQKVGVLISI